MTKNIIISISNNIPYSNIIGKTISILTKCKVIINDSQNTNAEIYSPEEANYIFKYYLNNYIDSLRKGANIILNLSIMCSDSIHTELFERILKELGYDFTFVTLFYNNHLSFKKLYTFIKSINPNINIMIYIYYIIKTILYIIILDKIKKEINILKEEELLINNIGIFQLLKKYIIFKKQHHRRKVKENKIKILLVGDTFSLFSINTKEIYNKLIKENINVLQRINLSYILLKKTIKKYPLFNKKNKYLKYPIININDLSVYETIYNIKNGLDGIIHVSSNGNVNEPNNIVILKEIGRDYNVPILFLNNVKNKELIARSLNSYLNSIYNNKIQL